MKTIAMIGSSIATELPKGACTPCAAFWCAGRKGQASDFPNRLPPKTISPGALLFIAGKRFHCLFAASTIGAASRSWRDLTIVCVAVLYFLK
jgi:hypothetical protein